LLVSGSEKLMGLNDTNNINSIELSELTVGEWYKDALLPLSDGLSAGPAPAPTATTPTAAAAAAATAANPPTAAAPQKPAASTPPAQPPAPPPQPPVQPPAPAPIATIPPPETPGYKFLGNNRRKTTLLVHSPGTPFLPDNQLTFLTKILEACRMTLADVAIVNHAAAPVTIAAIKQQLQPKIVLLFGLDPTAIRLPINFPHFKQLSYDDCVYLSSPALDQLVPNTEESKLLKSKLWVSLKTIFDV
jgi:hypothetical protein